MARLKRPNRTALILALAGVFGAAGLAVGYMTPFAMPHNTPSAATQTERRPNRDLSHPSTRVLDALRAARYHSATENDWPLNRTWPSTNWPLHKQSGHHWQPNEWTRPAQDREPFPAIGDINSSSPRPSSSRGIAWPRPQAPIPSAPSAGDGSPYQGIPVYWVFYGPGSDLGNGSGNGGGMGGIPDSATDGGLPLPPPPLFPARCG